jgi:hypothetical protein
MRRITSIVTALLLTFTAAACQRDGNKNAAPADSAIASVPAPPPAAATAQTESSTTSPPTPIAYEVPGLVVPLKQPTNMTCWATAYTILASWKSNSSLAIATALSPIAGGVWKTLFDGNKAIDATQKNRFLTDATLRAEAPQNPSPAGWASLLRTYGPLWVTTDEAPGRHARILIGINGDGTAGGTKLKFVDPASGSIVQETIVDFIVKYESVIRTDLGLGSGVPIHSQIVHW